MAWFQDTLGRLGHFQNRMYDKTWDIAPNWIEDKKPGGWLGNYQKHLFNTSTIGEGTPFGYVADYYGQRDLGLGKGKSYGTVGANAGTSAAILAAIFGGSALAGAGEEGGSAGSEGAGLGGDSFGAYGGNYTAAGEGSAPSSVFSPAETGGSSASLDVGSTFGNTSQGGIDFTGATEGGGDLSGTSAFEGFGQGFGGSGTGSLGSSGTSFNYKKALSKALANMQKQEQNQQSAVQQRQADSGQYVLQPSALNPVAGGQSPDVSSGSPYSPEAYGAYGAPNNRLYQQMLAAALSGVDQNNG